MTRNDHRAARKGEVIDSRHAREYTIPQTGPVLLAALPPMRERSHIREAAIAVETLSDARRTSERVRFMWTRACEALEEAHRMRSSLRERINPFAAHEEYRQKYLQAMLAKMLDAGIDGSGADMGNIQLLDPQSGELVIYAHRGFREPFLNYFSKVHSGAAACGAALHQAERVIVCDTADSEIFAAPQMLEVMLDAGARAVQSTPLATKSGVVLGMLSTHYRKPTEPSVRDLRVLDYVAGWAVALLEAECRPAAWDPPRAFNPELA
jgi:hypothetical protein